ncbi:MAG: HAD-IA family hydrolase [Chloroflexota bacterium]|jgi:putative hydrolase of the HAD superfamily
MSIRGIIFDFGEVLNAPIDREQEVARRAEAAARLGVPPESLWTYLFDREASKQWMTGKLTWQQFWTKVLAPHGITDPEEIEAYARYVLPVTRRLNPEMVRLLAELKHRYILGVVSNASWTEAEMRRMFYNDFELPDDTFDVIVTSNSAGAVKPQLAIFEQALSRMGLKAEETVFTDDMPQFTAAASSLGIHSHTFTTPAEFRAFLASLDVDVNEQVAGEPAGSAES